MTDNEENDPSYRYALQTRYLELTRQQLPTEARRQGWVVTQDHCFMRIFLDRLFGDCWYKHLDRRRAAYQQLSKQQLEMCIDMAEQILSDDNSALEDWNRDSLRWRGKLK